MARPLDDDAFVPFLLMHRAIRDGLRLLPDATAAVGPADREPLRAVQQWFGFIARAIHHHHRAEDDVLYPLIAARDPSFVAERTRLEVDHRQLDPAIAGIVAALRQLATTPAAGFPVARDALVAAARSLHAQMVDHLDREEAALIERMKHIFTDDDLARAEREMARSASLADMADVLPWVLASATDRERERVERLLPGLVRVLYRMWWKRSFERFARPIHDLCKEAA